MERGSVSRPTRRGTVLPRTAPYLGVACLALLALANAHALMGDPRALIRARGLQAPRAAWLAGPTGAAALPPATALAATVARAFATPGARLAAVPMAAAARRHAPPRPAPSPLTRGALAMPALLVAVALALRR
jgi:hypothetical protein